MKSKKHAKLDCKWKEKNKASAGARGTVKEESLLVASSHALKVMDSIALIGFSPLADSCCGKCNNDGWLSKQLQMQLN
jgi:hypothetical protein